MNPVISNNFALTALKQGEDAFVCDLTNQMDAVPVDANGKVTSKTDVSTTARIIKGAGVIPSGITPSPAASMVIAGVTPTVNIADGEVTYTWSFAKGTTVSDARYVKKITLTYNGHSYSADFTLVTDKSGATYNLLPSLSEIPFVRNDSNVLIPDSMYVYCGYVKNQDGTVTTVNGKGDNQHTNIDSRYYIYYRIKNADGTYGSYTQMTKSGIKVNNSDTYAAIEFVMSSATTVGGIADANIIDIEDVPVVRQNERGYGIVCSVQRNNFTEAQWNTDPGYGVIGHSDTFTDTSSIRNGARKGDLFTVVGTATDTHNGHTATYRCTNASGNLSGVCIAHQISKAGDNTATVQLFRRSATALTASDKPTDTLTYTFSTGKLTGDGFNSWSQTVPANDGNPLYIIVATAYSSSDTDTIAANEWSSPVLYNKDGMHIAPVFLYKRGATAPDKPTAELTYTFSTGALTGSGTNPLAGWSQNIPSTDGHPCWVIQATAVGTGTTDKIAASEWSEQSKLVEDGTSPYVADLDNEMDSVVCDADGKTTSEQYIETNVCFYKGNTKQTIKSSGGIVCKIGSYELGSDYAAEGSPTPAATYKAVVTGLGTTSAKVKIYIKSGTSITSTNITITVKSTIDGADRTADLVLTMNGIRPGGKGENAILYNLMPSVSEINIGRTDAGGYSPTTFELTCGYKKNNGGTITSVENATSRIDSKYYIYYRRRTRSDQSWEGTYFRYDYYRSDSSHSLTALDVTTYDAVEFIICTASATSLYVSNIGNYTLIDKETVPVISDGKKGDGGNGINNVTLYRMFTQGFEEPLANDSGWKAPSDSNYPTETGLSKENRYLWQKKVTTYTKTSNTTTEISLLAQFDSGLCENILEDTAFLSEGQMEAWDEKNGVIGVNTIGGHNSFGGDPVWANQYTELLKQRVYRSGVIQKLKSNTWYTLSFVAAQANYGTLFSGTTYNGDGDTNYGYVNKVHKQFFVEKNNTVKLQFTGYNASSNVRMTCYLYCRRASSSDWEISTSQQITGTGVKTVTLTLQNTTGRDAFFECEVVVYDTSTGNINTNSGSNYRGYIQALTIDRGARMASYLYRSDNGQAVIHSASAPWYVDGKKITAATTLDDGESGNPLRKGTYADFNNDGGVYWQLSPDHVRHTVTFKTPTLVSGVDYCVLFRLTAESNYGWVSMPKLEENTMSTDWIENTNDRMADDIQHVYVGAWKASTDDVSTHYFYGGGTGVRHVVRAKESVSGAKTYFRMKKRTTSAGYKSTIEPYNDTEHWEKADFLKFVAAEFMLVDEAIINFAQTNRILVYNSSGNVAAGMGGAEGGDNDYPLWVGANYAQRGNAPFRVTLTGKLYATEANIRGRIEGSVRNPFKLVYDSFSTYDKDNLAMMTEEGWGAKTSFSLSWDVNQSGRVIRLSSYAWNSNNFPTAGWGVIDAPTGKYFYENGRRFSHLYFSREMIELVGYGTDTTFYGWVVTKRVDFMTEKAYGMENRCIMMGRILGATTSNGTTVTGKGYRFDGNSVDAPSVQLTRQDAGVYKLTIPTSWKLTEDSIQVQTSPIGYVKDGGNMLLNASVRSFEKSGGYISAIIFQLSDDDSTNDGDMYFAIYNMEQYLQWMAN